MNPIETLPATDETTPETAPETAASTQEVIPAELFAAVQAYFQARSGFEVNKKPVRLTVKQYRLLKQHAPGYAAIYRRQFGRPLTNDEIRGVERKRAKRIARKRIARASRNRNR